MPLINVRVHTIYSSTMAEMANGKSNGPIVTTRNHDIHNGVSKFVSPEYNVPWEVYLNLYHGLDVDPSNIAHYTEMTLEQKAIYEDFLQLVRHHDFDQEDGIDTAFKPFVLPDDMTCLRFLQSDDYDMDKAFDRIVATLKWHQELRLPHVISTPPAKLQEYREIRVRGYMGRAKNGMPVFTERLGGMLNGMGSKDARSFSDMDWVQCFVYDHASVIKRIRETYMVNNIDNKHSPTKGRTTTWKAIWIMDVKGISPFKGMRATPCVKVIDSVTEPNFPENAGPIYLINCPTIVAGIWRVCKAFMDPAVVEKIQIHAGVPTEALLEKIPEDVLLEEYGGTNKTPFPKCKYAP